MVLSLRDRVINPITQPRFLRLYDVGFYSSNTIWSRGHQMHLFTKTADKQPIPYCVWGKE